MRFAHLRSNFRCPGSCRLRGRLYLTLLESRNQSFWVANGGGGEMNTIPGGLAGSKVNLGKVFFCFFLFFEGDVFFDLMRENGQTNFHFRA